MSTGFERRVERLRKQVLSHQVEEFKPAEESIIDLSKMKVDDLKDLLDEKGITYDSKAKREDLIKLLEDAE